MIYKVEESLTYFKFWGHAESTAREFTEEQLDQLEVLISDMFCDDYPTDTEINDLFAYDSDYLKELLDWKKLSSGEYVNPDDVPDYDDEATAENIDLILDLAGVDRDTRRELGRIAEDVNIAQRDAERDSHPFSIEDLIDALEAVQNDGDAEDVQNTALFFIYPQAMSILLGTYALLCESGIDLDEVKNIIYE